ncbi:MAG: MerR family transcriptional regulator, partial [Nitrospinota bacterium]|nr:MerR family transcriptional regulator [Nitrospinota bacterium]
YYSISEVSEITELKQYVLRYWETEFSQLKPSKNQAGNRTYRSHDIDVIIGIKSLLYDRKFTIKGAKQHLNRPTENTNQTVVPKKIIKLTNSLDVRMLRDLK